MKKLKEEPKTALIEGTKAHLTNVIKFTFDQLGEKPFHLYGRLNYAAMDSILVATGVAVGNGIKNLKDRYSKLVADKEYSEWVTSDTSDEKILTSRIKRATEILAE